MQKYPRKNECILSLMNKCKDIEQCVFDVASEIDGFKINDAHCKIFSLLKLLKFQLEKRRCEIII